MWSQRFRLDERKYLSPVELLVLILLNSEKPLRATDIIHKINEVIPNYSAERGTIYPILHRLTNVNLLDRVDQTKLIFKRSDYGSAFISSISNTLLHQIESNIKFYSVVARELSELDPIMAIEFLTKFSDEINQLQEDISSYKKKAQQRLKDDNWHEIPLE